MVEPKKIFFGDHVSHFFHQNNILPGEVADVSFDNILYTRKSTIEPANAHFATIFDGMSTFAEKLKSARTKKDLSLKELAELSHVSFRQVCKYEQGVAIPRKKPMRQLAKALDVPEFYFDEKNSSTKRVVWDEKLDRNWKLLKKFELSAADTHAINHVFELILKSKQMRKLSSDF